MYRFAGTIHTLDRRIHVHAHEHTDNQSNSSHRFDCGMLEPYACRQHQIQNIYEQREKCDLNRNNSKIKWIAICSI